MINKKKLSEIRIIARQNYPFIIDLEASGFGPDSYPIEVGLALEPDERYCRLIRPQPDWTHWSEEAGQYHQIPRQHLFDYGMDVKTIATELNQRLRNQTVYSDGWVVDHSWLIKLFHSAGISMQFRFSALEMILSEAQMAIWHEVKAEVEQELQVARHRASNDALIIQQTFLRTAELTAPTVSSARSGVRRI